MKYLLFLAVFDGLGKLGEGDTTFGKALIIALVSILIVFIILALIIGAIKIMEQFFKNKKAEAPKAVAQEKPQEEKNLEITDDDMMAAVLVATIDYANETKKDVRLKSVKRIG